MLVLALAGSDFGLDSVFVSVDGLAPVSVFAGGGFTMVVLVSAFLVSAGAAAGVTSVFCSHAPRSAALAKMQISFFIVVDWLPHLGTKPESEHGEFPALLK